MYFVISKLIVILFVCFPLLSNAQGFGSFSHDQPFFGVDSVSSSGSGDFTDPSSIPGLVAWYDFSKPQYVFESNYLTNECESADSVGSVTDLSGNANHLHTQATPGATTQYYINYVGGWTNGGIWPNSAGNLKIQKDDASKPYTSGTNWFFFLGYKWSDGEGTVFSGFSTNFGVNSSNAIVFTVNSAAANDGRFIVTNYHNAGLGDSATYKGVKKQVWYLFSVKYAGTNSLVRTNGVQLATFDLDPGYAQKGLSFSEQFAGSTGPFAGWLLYFLWYGNDLTSNQVYHAEHYIYTNCPLFTLP